MWKIQLPGGEFLDSVPPLTFELNNQVFSNSDSSVLPGSFSFPVDLPLNPTNRRLLNFPDLVTNSRNFQTYAGCWVYAEGIPMFYGTLTIRSATGRKCSINIVANPLSALKTVPLRDLSLGGDRTFADAAAVLAHAKLTAQNPLDYDYVFFPVFNPDYIDHPDYSQPKSYFQNFYDPAAAAFDVAHEYPALMPFVRLEYLLEQIFQGQEFTFRNRFQTTDELRQICLYNNRSLWTSEGLEKIINLANHLSDTASTTLLRKVMSGFNLGLFTRIFDHTIDLIPLRDIVSRLPIHDWTPHCVLDQVVEGTQDQAEYLCWKTDSNDGAFAWYEKQKKPADADVLDTITTPDLLTVPDGIYYVEDQHAYFSVGGRIKHLFTTLGCAPVQTGTRKFEAECQALWDAHHGWESYVGAASENYGMRKMPQVRMSGTVSYKITPDGGGDPEQINSENAIPDRLTFYRGMYDVWGGTDTYPLASGLPWDAKGNLIGDYSLRWDGTYGMYESWWRSWHQILIAGKHVTQSFMLPISELIRFSFEDKVRVVNMDFFIKRLRVQKLVGRGLALVEASMVSTV